MDLWDVTKVLWRRKWVALPLLVLTVAMAFFVSSTVKPDYKTTGHVTLLPPSEQPATETKPQPARTVSPWNVYSLADALVIYSARADVKREFAESNLSEEWIASIGGTQLPIVEIEVVASSPEEAKATLSKLIDSLTAQLERLQTPYGVTGGQAITLQALDSGQNVQAITSNIKRMLIVVTAIGLIITLSSTLLLDALLRRRQLGRRAQGRARPERQSERLGMASSLSGRRPYPDDRPDETQVITTNGARSGRATTNGAAESKPVVPEYRSASAKQAGGNGTRSRPSMRNGDEVDETMVISGIAGWSRQREQAAQAEPSVESMPSLSEEATTVLPLSRLRWIASGSDDGQRPPAAKQS
ncbi:hypothetical protein K1W54_08940 [Micromonospora sp. CPCC 205371]|nr:hypothetical protein [Micromonospora sp. CPCC 205371]